MNLFTHREQYQKQSSRRESHRTFIVSPIAVLDFNNHISVRNNLELKGIYMVHRRSRPTLGWGIYAAGSISSFSGERVHGFA